MNWYQAKLIFRIASNLDGPKAQFDEQVRLITANNLTEAYTKAMEKGQLEQCQFSETFGKVSWKFMAVTELITFEEPYDGIEVYSRIAETDDLKGYLITMRRKAETIQEQELFSKSNILVNIQ